MRLGAASRSALAHHVLRKFLTQVLHVAITVLSKLGKYPEALRLALRLQDEDAVTEIMGACEDP